MTVTGGEILDVALGDPFDIILPVTNVPASVTISKGWFMVKRNRHDIDADALISKMITPSLVANVGQVTDTGADGTGEVHFQVRGVDYADGMTATTTYYYGIKVLLSNGLPVHVETGVIEFMHALVDATA